MDDDVRMLKPEEAAEIMRVTRRRMLQLPIKQHRLGDRTIRYRLADIYSYLGIEDPNDGNDSGAGACPGPLWVRP